MQDLKGDLIVPIQISGRLADQIDQMLCFSSKTPFTLLSFDKIVFHE